MVSAGVCLLVVVVLSIFTILLYMRARETERERCARDTNRSGHGARRAPWWLQAGASTASAREQRPIYMLQYLYYTKPPPPEYVLLPVIFLYGTGVAG